MSTLKSLSSERCKRVDCCRSRKYRNNIFLDVSTKYYLTLFTSLLILLILLANIGFNTGENGPPNVFLQALFRNDNAWIPYSQPGSQPSSEQENARRVQAQRRGKGKGSHGCGRVLPQPAVAWSLPQETKALDPWITQGVPEHHETCESSRHFGIICKMAPKAEDFPKRAHFFFASKDGT